MTATANDLLIGPVVVANGVSTISVDFLVEDESWLEVYKSGSETPLILNIDYTFSGEGTDSGTVTLTVAADGVDSYSVYLIQPKERSSDLQFRGDFRSGPINLELDRVWRAIQGLDTSLNRTLRISKVSNIPAPLDTETAIERANASLAFSADGTVLGLGPTTDTIEGATTAAAAASVSAGEAAASAASVSASDVQRLNGTFSPTLANTSSVGITKARWSRSGDLVTVVYQFVSINKGAASGTDIIGIINTGLPYLPLSAEGTSFGAVGSFLYNDTSVTGAVIGKIVSSGNVNLYLDNEVLKAASITDSSTDLSGSITFITADAY